MDPVVVALTGKLPFYLLLAAVLTWPVALATLSVYARAVRKSMRTQARGAQAVRSTGRTARRLRPSATSVAARLARLQPRRELARRVPLDRVVFVVNRRTDEKLLGETLGGARAGVLRLPSMKPYDLLRLLRALAASASHTSTVTA
jgi:hypothetical protein